MASMMLDGSDGVAAQALPVQALKDHLRLGSGFSDDGMQDGLIEAYLRAAMAAIEARIGKQALARRLKLVLADWRRTGEQALPVAPVTALVSVALVDANEVAVPVAVDRYRLVQDMHRPKLVAVGCCCRRCRRMAAPKWCLTRALARLGRRFRPIWRRRCCCWRRSTTRTATILGSGRPGCRWRCRR